MTTYASGEFSLKIGGRPVPRATANFDSKIWLIGCGNIDNGDMYQSGKNIVRRAQGRSRPVHSPDPGGGFAKAGRQVGGGR